MEVYILYLLFCILCLFLVWDLRNGNNIEMIIFSVVTAISICGIGFIPLLFFPDDKWRKTYKNKECKNRCIVVHRAWSVWETKCDHCLYCPHAVHKYQHKIFKHTRIFKNKFLGY